MFCSLCSKAVKKNDCSFCDKSTIFTGSLPMNMTIHIRYGGISEINPDNRKFDILSAKLPKKHFKASDQEQEKLDLGMESQHNHLTNYLYVVFRNFSDDITCFCNWLT